MGIFEFRSSNLSIKRISKQINKVRKKISLITGVAGTIGSNLALSLIKQGHLVYGIDNFSLGSKKNLKKIIKNKNFNLFN